MAQLRRTVVSWNDDGAAKQLLDLRQKLAAAACKSHGEAAPLLVDAGAWLCAGALAATAGVAYIEALTVAHLDGMTNQELSEAGVKVALA